MEDRRPARIYARFPTNLRRRQVQGKAGVLLESGRAGGRSFAGGADTSLTACGLTKPAKLFGTKLPWVSLKAQGKTSAEHPSPKVAVIPAVPPCEPEASGSRISPPSTTREGRSGEEIANKV